MRRKAPVVRTYSLDQLRSSAATGVYRKGVISGLGGRLLVRDAEGKMWLYAPSKVHKGKYSKQRITNFRENVNWESAIRGETKKKRMERFVKRSDKIPFLRIAEFELNLSREEFARIYTGLMNEINVRKNIDARAEPFDTRLQETREKQAEKIAKSKDELRAIHHFYPQEIGSDYHYAGMTNDLGANVFVEEKNGKPVIVISDHLRRSKATRETGYLALALESILRRTGIKYTKKTE